MKNLKHLEQKLSYQYEALTNLKNEIIELLNNPENSFNYFGITDARKKRDLLLKKSDVYLLSDFPKGDITIEQIETYRQALRDLPSQENYPEEITWPVNPLEL